MCIIRVLVVLTALLVVVSPQIASADEAQDPNETKINFEIEDNIILEDGVVKDKNSTILAQADNNPKDLKSLLSEERAAVLAKFQHLIEKAKFPKGKFKINASAYTASADECGNDLGITASGLKVEKDETLACPPEFPFGTKIYISGIGTRVCEDRGGAIKGNHIDIYVETKAEAFGFGRRNLEAEVVM